MPTALWSVTPDLVLALDERLGPPVDSYLNGSQTWLLAAGDDEDEVVLEWRLHPVAAFRGPAGASHYEWWDSVVGELAAGVDPDALAVGEERRALTSLWEGLEVFPAYGDEMEPAVLARRGAQRLGIEPAQAGLVDHERIAGEWERSRGAASVVELLRAQLRG